MAGGVLSLKKLVLLLTFLLMENSARFPSVEAAVLVGFGFPVLRTKSYVESSGGRR